VPPTFEAGRLTALQLGMHGAISSVPPSEANQRAARRKAFEQPKFWVEDGIYPKQNAVSLRRSRPLGGGRYQGGAEESQPLDRVSIASRAATRLSGILSFDWVQLLGEAGDGGPSLYCL
jgi:hypothetical protein